MLTIESGFSEIFYKGKPREYITFWVRIEKKDYLFPVKYELLNKTDECLKAVKHKLINVLNMDNLQHIRFKEKLLNL